MAIDAKDIGELQKALNDASSKASALWIAFITFELYLAIAFGAVTHRDLFLENPINLPVLNVDLPLVGFFVVAPTVLLIFHFYIFLQLLALARKAADFNALLKKEVPNEVNSQFVRHRLDSFLMLQFLAGPADGLYRSMVAAHCVDYARRSADRHLASGASYLLALPFGMGSMAATHLRSH
jgi:hypothetical protein